MNKKLLLWDTIAFLSGIFLLVLYSLLFMYNDNLIIRLIFTVISIIFSIILLFVPYKDIDKMNFLNVILPLTYYILFYTVYLLPFFNFVGFMGANNNICMIYEFLFGAKFLSGITCFLLIKNKTATNLNTSQDHIEIIFKIFRYFALFCFFGGLLGSIVNIFSNTIDMSAFFQFVFQHKRLSEII